jgi:hypothetical protein
MKIKSLMVVLTFFLSTQLFASQLAYTVRSVPLLQSPSTTSTIIAQLDKESTLRLLKRRGGWYQVRSDVGEGWIKMISVRFVPKANQQTAVGSVKYQSSTTLTTGVRGLDEVGMVSGGKGVPLKQLDRYVVSKERAVSFAKEGNLSSREVDYVSQ